MSNVPNELRYTKSHEWLKAESDGVFLLGITDHAQDQLGDMVCVELQEAGQAIDAQGECAVIESVKAASEVYMPISGEILESNNSLADSPETINQDPYGKGWMLKIKASNPGDFEALMDASSYSEFLES